MTFKSIIKSFVAFCITATLGVALCSCDDLGEYETPEAYYNAFGDIVLIDGALGEVEEYSVETYFYNKESRDNFLAGEDGAYRGVEHREYVYMAIPFESDIDMDTLALYLHSESDVSVYINVYVSDKIPSNWQSIADKIIPGAPGGNEAAPAAETVGEPEEGPEEEYDDPAPETRIAEVKVNLKKEKWSAFVLDTFKVNGSTQKSIQIKDGQYILLQFRNNSGVRIFDADKQVYVDPQTGLELPKAEITMTNLLIRALEVKSGGQAQGGE